MIHERERWHYEDESCVGFRCGSKGDASLQACGQHASGSPLQDIIDCAERCLGMLRKCGLVVQKSCPRPDCLCARVPSHVGNAFFEVWAISTPARDSRPKHGCVHFRGRAVVSIRSATCCGNVAIGVSVSSKMFAHVAAIGYERCGLSGATDMSPRGASVTPKTRPRA